LITTLDVSPYIIDPEVLTRFDQRQTVFGRRHWDQDAAFYGQNVHDTAGHAMAGGDPGYSRLEYARLRAAWTVSDHFRGAYSWDRLGEPDPALARLAPYPVPDPALASEQVKGTARTYGADLAGICEVDRRWLYSYRMDGSPVDIAPEFQYAVVMAVRMDAAGIMDAPTFRAGTATGVGYSRMAFCIACLAEFLRNLGYRALPMGNDTALSIPLAIDAGLGELGRNGLLITPQYGPCVRLCKVLTDMPLRPDRPISFGVAQTCQACSRCTEACEVEAISTAPETSYEVVCPSNNRGIRRWAVNHDRCYSFWVENGASCSTCIAACPYTRRAMRERTTDNGRLTADA
jgi:epoxyqueuosine reductase